MNWSHMARGCRILLAAAIMVCRNPEAFPLGDAGRGGLDRGFSGPASPRDEALEPRPLPLYRRIICPRMLTSYPAYPRVARATRRPVLRPVRRHWPLSFGVPVNRGMVVQRPYGACVRRWPWGGHGGVPRHHTHEDEYELLIDMSMPMRHTRQTRANAMPIARDADLHGGGGRRGIVLPVRLKPHLDQGRNQKNATYASSPAAAPRSDRKEPAKSIGCSRLATGRTGRRPASEGSAGNLACGSRWYQ